MSSKKEISEDIWAIFRQVYNINELSAKSDKQEELLNKIVEYIDTNSITRRKKVDGKESTCSKD